MKIRKLNLIIGILSILIIGIVGASEFGYNYLENPNSLFGEIEFNGGWMDDGVSIIDGDIYAQTGYFYNISSLNVTRQNLTILDYLNVEGTLMADSIFQNGNQVIDVATADYLTLTDNSVANALHRHSELVASDGSPDPALSVDASGKVGIGTTSPSEELEVVGEMTINGAIYSGGYRSSRGDGDIYLYHAAVTDNTYFGSQSGATMILQGDGNVGIGTASPSATLDVEANQDAFKGLVEFRNVHSTNVNSMLIGLFNHGNSGIRFGDYNEAINAGSGNYLSWSEPDQKFHFLIAGTEKVTIQNNGNVGIGTTSPQNKLNVLGLVNSTGYIVNSSVGYSGFCVNTTYLGGIAISCND